MPKIATKRRGNKNKIPEKTKVNTRTNTRTN
jgi:hypothetical protein